MKSLELLERSELGVSSVTNGVLVGNSRDETGSLWTYAGSGPGTASGGEVTALRRAGAAMAGFTPRRIFTAAVRAVGISINVPALVA